MSSKPPLDRDWMDRQTRAFSATPGRRAAYRFSLGVPAALAAWVAVPNAWRAEQCAGSAAFLEDLEKGTRAGWPIQPEDAASFKAIKVEAIDGGKAYQLTGPAVPDLGEKPNEARVLVENVDGDTPLHVQGPVSVGRQGRRARNAEGAGETEVVADRG